MTISVKVGQEFELQGDICMYVYLPKVEHPEDDQLALLTKREDGSWGVLVRFNDRGTE